MTDVGARVSKMTEMRVTVTRCGCGDPSSHLNVCCPQGVADPSGTRVLRSYHNPLRQFVWDHTGR
jgi:hypothetical protein